MITQLYGWNNITERRKREMTKTKTKKYKGFYGDYDVTVKVGGQVVKTEMAAFHKGYDNVLTITIN